MNSGHLTSGLDITFGLKKSGRESLIIWKVGLASDLLEAGTFTPCASAFLKEWKETVK